MDLYSLIFESVNTSGFALLTLGDASSKYFIVYDADKMYQHRDEINLVTEEIQDKFMRTAAVDLFKTKFIVGTVEVRQSPSKAGNCAGAYDVAAAGRNPLYPGMGREIYRIASSVLGAPITSDRDMGTTDVAKSMWRRIEKDPAFKKVELDNYLAVPDPKDRRGLRSNVKYVDIPNPETAFFRDGPRTPDPSDDCKVPGSSLDNIKNKLGTADAYIADTVDVSHLRQKHEEASNWILKEFGIPREEFEKVLDLSAGRMFRDLYMDQI